MPTKASMEDLTRICCRLEEVVNTCNSGILPPEVPESTRLVPYIAGSTLEIVRQLAYHIKQLQLEVLAWQRQTTSLPS